MKRRDTSDGWWIAAFVLANILLKFAWAGVNELGGDEPFTVYWAQRPLGELFSMLRTENNPPLYFLLMHWWSAATPLQTAWLRIPSAVFSALTAWPLYLLGKRLNGRIAAVTACLLFTLSQHEYGFAHEVRAYPLLVLACTWAVWQLVRLAGDKERHPSLRPWSILWLVVANVLATWAHYFGWLMVGLELLMVFTVPALRTVRMKMIAAALLAALCFLPWAGVMLSRAGASLGQGTWVQAPPWDEPYSMVVRWANKPVVAVAFLCLIVLASARKRITPRSIPLLWCAVPLIGMYLVSFRFPVYIDRYLLFASIGFYLLVAQAATAVLGRIGPKWPVPAACVLGMAVTFAPWKDTGAHPSRVVRQVAAWQKGRTDVVIQPSWYGPTYAWALDPGLFRNLAPIDIALAGKGIYSVEGTKPPALDTAVTTVVHIDAWSALTDPGHAVLDSLRTRFVQVDSAEADRKVIVRRFVRK